MKCFIIVALVLVGVTTSEVFHTILLFEGSWLEMKEERSGAVEYLTEFGVSVADATAYSKGPITLECIQLTEEEPNGDSYNTSITWRKGAKLPYKSLTGQSLKFDAEVLKDNATNHNDVYCLIILLSNVLTEKASRDNVAVEGQSTNKGELNLKLQGRGNDLFRHCKHIQAFQQSSILWQVRLKSNRPSYYILPSLLQHTEENRISEEKVNDIKRVIKFDLTTLSDSFSRHFPGKGFENVKQSDLLFPTDLHEICAFNTDSNLCTMNEGGPLTVRLYDRYVTMGIRIQHPACKLKRTRTLCSATHCCSSPACPHVKRWRVQTSSYTNFERVGHCS
ncbi:unnamed protein product [Lepeophtheirus salmonis]|uniref:(salmon louse) hypothetical protein n=1 Tax=Lepeophtheirus salmonis TaxID=72036 RepID=A0A7R8D108_LEPSM|nr:unnamed protein product [Lepeophtheirus salmonis]CAF2989549.1 unnamed protein product [Lepeophtheirus salmonis]